MSKISHNKFNMSQIGFNKVQKNWNKGKKKYKRVLKIFT